VTLSYDQSVVDLDVFSLAERPDLVAGFWSVPGDWPAFMLQSPVAARCYDRAVELFPDLHLVLLQGQDVVARLHAVPIVWPGAADLSLRGWDWALESSTDTPTSDRSAVSLIEARVAVSHRGRGLSAVLLRAARDKFHQLGTHDLVGPVRPNGKTREPRTPVAAYAARARPDGLPSDPWLRVHARLGGRRLHTAPLSMTIPGTLAQWREWTGMAFDADGPVDVEGGLVPVLVNTQQDYAVYIEPNVWVHHVL